MAYLDDRRLLVKVSHMYYEEGATQSEIAKKIGVSRSLISKYLAKAKKMGIVEIIIHDEVYQSFTNLESKLEKLYGLREVVCVPSADEDNSKTNVAYEASKYLLRMVRDDQIIGISAGTTLYEVANAISSSQYFPSLSFVPLVGGVGDEKVDIHANSIAAKFAEKLQAKYHLLHAPVMVDTKEAKDIIINQLSIKNIFDLGSKANIAVVGIGGSPEHSTMVKSYQSYGVADALHDNEVVGDICYNFIDENGNVPDNAWNEKAITMDPNKLKEIPLVIGVACGKEKVKAIKAALRGKLIHVLITDEITANLLLD